MTGIGITVHNRNETAAKTIEQIRYYAPIGAKIVIVDDASKIPFEGADYRFNVNAGIAQAKNKCFELLDDCEHIFLFDDDCYPIKTGWELPYIESGEKHLSFTFANLSNGRQNGNKVLLEHNGFNVFNNPCGCMCYFHKDCLDAVGGFNPVYKVYGYEHVDLSVRIHNAGLTPHRFMDITDSLDYFHSLDYHSSIASSVGALRSNYVRLNKQIYDQMQSSKEFIPYKPMPKKHQGNCVLTAYFNYCADPQRKKRWPAQIDELKALIDSCIKHKTKLFIFTDCFVDTINSEYIEFVRTLPSKTHSPNVYRWIVYWEWMQKNSFNKIWMVDSTDVELLKNPFNIMDYGYIYCGDEFGMVTDNRWMRTHQERHFKIDDYRKVIEANADKILINCGIVGGLEYRILQLMEIWAGIHKTKTVGLMHSTDMAVFNYVCRKHFDEVLFHGEKINTKFKYFETKNKTAIWKHK